MPPSAVVTGTSYGERATVGGGYSNHASGYAATVGGGNSNLVDGIYATVGGGYANEASGEGATVGGGFRSEASGVDATVGGGYENEASGEGATVGGGWTNIADGIYATVGGGIWNTAAGDFNTVGGGYENEASGSNATVGGGSGNTAIGGATVGGGLANEASSVGTVPGGFYNVASGNQSFAAGGYARATHDGAFVWGDQTYNPIYSAGDNTFVVRANGGIWFGQSTSAYTPTIDPGVFLNTSTGGYLSTGGKWQDSSDRNLKENFVPVDNQEILERLAGLPITTWNYKAEDPSVRHMGPVAQDFYATFGLGLDDRHIAPADAASVALAAIQGLYAQNQDLATENAALQAEVDDLEARVAALETAVGTSQAFGQVPSGWLSLAKLGMLLGGLAVVAAVAGRRRLGGGR